MGKSSSSFKSRKSRVKIYDTIQKALDAGGVGKIFSTKRANRLYVSSRGRGRSQAKDVPTAGGRIAKGFTPGVSTPSSSWASIKKHANRTSIKHGGISSKRIKKKYGAGSKEQVKET